jgi:hypothetical protein
VAGTISEMLRQQHSTSADLNQGITIIIFLAFLLVIMRRTNRLLIHVDPTSTVQYPLLKPLWLQIAPSECLFFVRLVLRIAEGAQGEFELSLIHCLPPGS